MGLFLLLLGITLAVGLLCYLMSLDHERLINAATGLCICVMISAFIGGMVFGKSYTNYMDLKKLAAVVEQYKSSIEIYKAKGLTEFKAGNEITDLKYNNYQEQMGILVRQLRNVVVRYNKILAGKRFLKDGFLIGWFIYLPEDLEIIKMGL